jgi:hypothetical protein
MSLVNTRTRKPALSLIDACYRNCGPLSGMSCTKIEWAGDLVMVAVMVNTLDQHDRCARLCAAD